MFFLKRAICILAGLYFSAILLADSAISLTKVTIDAGHGGSDPGAVSKDRKTYEKTLTLDISKRLAEKIKKNYPDMDVRLTRSDDSFVSLADRAVKANRWGSQLFISIHINSTKSTTPNGYSVHLLGESSNKDRDLFAYNMDVCKRENSVILLESDYSTKYQGFDPNDSESFIFMQLMQNSHLEQSLDFAQCLSDCLKKSDLSANRGIWQNPFYVLWKTAMPSVLVELGFISNQEDLSVLRSPARRDTIAACIFRALELYKAKYDGAVTLQTEPANSGSSVCYGIQLFAGTNLLPSGDKSFLGFKPTVIKLGNYYKYIVCIDESIDAVKKNKLTINKKYPNAFIVRLSKDKSTQEYSLAGAL